MGDTLANHRQWAKKSKKKRLKKLFKNLIRNGSWNMNIVSVKFTKWIKSNLLIKRDNNFFNDNLN